MTTCAAGLPWCVEHDAPNPREPGVVTHWSRIFDEYPVPLTLTRDDDGTGRAGAVRIVLGRDVWLAPAQARRLAVALLELAGVAEDAPT